MTCCQCQGIRSMFDERTARKDLKRYRKRGPSRTTGLLLDALRSEGVQGATLLDIGGGVGAIPSELLRAGAEHATLVDASPAYLDAARAELERRGCADLADFRQGDFVAVAPEIPAADVVTLDRVICCYDEMEALVSASAQRARRLYGLVYPRDTWWDRLGVSVANLAFRLRRTPFRVFVHPTERVEAVVRAQGLRRRFHRTTWLWQVAVFGR